MSPVPLFFAQINPLVGDLAGNAEHILAAYRAVGSNGSALVITPELSLLGYPPEDLLLVPSFRAEAMRQARRIASATGEAGLIFGTVWEDNGVVFNAAVLAAQGRIRHVHRKIILPNHGVFDEKRYFSPGASAEITDWQGHRIALLICEDVWHAAPIDALVAQKPALAIVINASPFERGKRATRERIVAQVARRLAAPVAYVNLVGGQDDLVFDGGSCLVQAGGEVCMRAPEFAAGVYAAADMSAPALSEEAACWEAMTLGLSDYVRKNGFPGVILGLSGGIDSALTAAIAVDALGKDRVRGVLLPSPYTREDSLEDARESARLLGIHTDLVPISDAMDTLEATLAPLMRHIRDDLSVGGNLQARLRGVILMAISNKTGALLLSTGNKSEIAVGYTTLYGDSCGGYNCIKDLYKTEIYALAAWRNARMTAIPARSITKPPSAELVPGQKDSDQLPEYALLDRLLALHLEGRKSEAEIVAEGFDPAVVARVVALVRMSEYKRRQSAPGVKLSPMLFGRDRRFPMTRGA